MYDVGLHRQPVIFCLDRAGITGDDGPSHHGVLDMALLSKVPGMTILAPSSYQELGQMLRDALDIVDGPVAIRWPKTAARNVPDDEVGHGLDGPQGPDRLGHLHPVGRQDARRRRRRRRRARGRGRLGDACGTPGRSSRSTRG